MSSEAMQWVLGAAPDLPSHLAMTLVGLAWHADGDGRNAYPAQATLAAYCRKTERAIRNEVRELARLGLIRRGDPRAVAHIPADRRPNVWDLAVERTAPTGTTVPVAGGIVVPVAGGTTVPGGTPVPGGTTVPPADENSPSEPGETGSESDGTTGTTVPGGTGVPGGTVVPPNNPSNYVTTDVSIKDTPPKTRRTKTATVTPISDEAFDRFWTVYPRKTAKGTARTAWAKALKRGANPEAVIAAAERFRDHLAATKANPKYTPYPASWLNGERYDDEPEQAGPQKAAANGHPYKPSDFTEEDYRAGW